MDEIRNCFGRRHLIILSERILQEALRGLDKQHVAAETTSHVLRYIFVYCNHIFDI